MKKIYLIRHAKSSWKDLSLDDFDRGLNSRGKRDLITMGNRLKNKNIMPDFIISSPAKRARKSAKKIANIIGFKNKIEYNVNLYESSIDNYLNILKNIDDKYEEVFIIGHNMTITNMAEKLANARILNMPTCSIICIEFGVESFKNIKYKFGKMVFFDYPKKI